MKLLELDFERLNEKSNKDQFQTKILTDVCFIVYSIESAKPKHIHSKIKKKLRTENN